MAALSAAAAGMDVYNALRISIYKTNSNSCSGKLFTPLLPSVQFVGKY